MAAVPPAARVPDGALVCVWYRVPAVARDATIAAAREIQREVGAAFRVEAAELHLRSDLPGVSTGPSAAQPAADDDPTLMETYQLADAADAAAFLALLADQAVRRLPDLVAARHVELFRPCPCAW